MDDVLALDAALQKLDKAVRMLRITGTDAAQAEKDYKVALAQEALKLRENGYAVTMIDKLVYGIPKVADLRFKRDVAKAVHEANEESINAIKYEIRILQERISQEWQQAGRE